MKRIPAVVILILCVFMLGVCSSGADMQSDSGSQSLHREDCLCGRDYYKANNNGRYIYDCVRCGKNMYQCECPCWCGAASRQDFFSITTLICTKCEKPCPECTCRDDKAEILAREKENMGRLNSALGLPIPGGAAAAFIQVFLLSAAIIGSALVFYLKTSKRLGKTGVKQAEINRDYGKNPRCGKIKDEGDGSRQTLRQRIAFMMENVRNRFSGAEYHSPEDEAQNTQPELSGTNVQKTDRTPDSDIPAGLPRSDALDAYGLCMMMKFALCGTEYHSAYTVFDSVPVADELKRKLPPRFENTFVSEDKHE